jgi:mono/diheme cytochrome c family protein
MRWHKLDRFLPGWIAGLLTVGVVGAIIGLCVIFGGLYDTRASTPHAPIVAWAVHAAMIHSTARLADASRTPKPVTPEALLAGAREYHRHCLACHGGPGMARAPWASAMLPTPPFLIDAPARWSHAELYTIIHDGVKMTAMPAWGEIDSDDQVANVVAFVEALPRLTPEQFRKLQTQAAKP